MRFLPHPFAIRHQNHGQAVPAGEKTAQAHRSRAAVGVVRVEELDAVGREIDKDDDVAADVAVRGAVFIGFIPRMQANRGSQFFLHRIVEDAAAPAARILHAIANACMPQCLFQTARTASTGMTVGKSVNLLQTVMASQGLQGAPAAPPRRPILHSAMKGDVNLRFRRHGGEQ